MARTDSTSRSPAPRTGRIPAADVAEIVARTDIVEAIGHHVVLRHRGRTHTGLCPFHDDHRPSFHVLPHLGAAKCFGCDWSGDVIAFQMKITGAPFRDAVIELAGRAGVPVAGADSAATSAPPLPPVRRASPPPSYPPGVAAFWDKAAPLVDALDEPLTAFTKARGLRPYLYDIREDDLARVTPLRGAWPAWWSPWRAQTWRLIVRAWTARGELASVHARAITTTPLIDGEPSGKDAWPKGYTCGRLFFADRHGLELLRGTPHPALFAVVICEGLTDWLAASAWFARRQLRLNRTGGGTDAPSVAVLGGVSGSFPALADVPWPDRPLDIVAAVDEDPAGDGYLLQIVDALAGRTIRRATFAALTGAA
jgi:hypothetical protein